MSSLQRQWNLQDSRGSIYCASEPDPISRIQYESGGLIRTYQADEQFMREHNHDGQVGQNGNADNIASSQPAPPSILTECQQSSGSLFSVVSAPQMPLAELDVKKIEALNHGDMLATGASVGVAGGLGLGLGLGFGLQPGLGSTIGGSAIETTAIGAANDSTATSMPNAIINSAATVAGTGTTDADGTPQLQRRPVTLTIDAPYCPAIGALAPPCRTLHASLLEHQISEIEEDDNENLLTVSSITARPLIAKSRELRNGNNKKSGKRGQTGSGNASNGKQSAEQSRNGKLRSQTGNGPRQTSAASSRSSEAAEPPDGGYGWFIVFGAFSVQFWVAGLVKSYGVLYVEIMETFPSSTATVASWIPAILSALCLALAPLSSALCQRFSCRTVVFIGGLFCALGMTLSYFATSLLHLLFTFGILTGIGGGLSTTPGIVIVSQYFDKHRALANGICVSGTAAGSFILPVLIKHLAENFGFHGTLLILGGCMLHVCVSATLYRPIESQANDALKEEDDAAKPLNDVNPSTAGMLTTSTYLETCEDGLNSKYIEHLFLEESKNRLNDIYTCKQQAAANEKSAEESDDEVKDMVGETTFIKPMKKVRSSGILHSVEDLSTDSTWVYRKTSGSDSNRGSRRRRNVFGNDEIISKIQAHLEKPLSPPTVVTRGLSKSMEIPTPVSNLSELKRHEVGSFCGSAPGMGGEPDVDDNDDGDKVARTCCERIQLYLDLSLLRDPTFILMCLSVTLMSVGCPYMLYYLPAHVISIGYNKSEAGYLVAVSAALDLFGRLGLGYLSDLQLFDRRKTYMVCILGAGIAVLTIPSANTLLLVGFSAGLYGLCLGSWYVLMPVLLADIFGTDRISSSYGLMRMFQSIGAISVPPLAGLLRDLSGSYEICFYCMGTCMVLGCVPLLVWTALDARDQRLYAARDESEENSIS